MTTAQNIFEALNRLAPLETQESYDNAGFLFGDRTTAVTKALLALDVTCDVIREAQEKETQLIITHHPLIFGSLKHIEQQDVTGRRVLALAKAGLQVISMHTNLDKADGGVNDALIVCFAPDRIEKCASLPYMRIGCFNAPRPFPEFLLQVKAALKSNGLRYVDSGRAVRKIACIGGAGDDGLREAFALGCDTFITADVHYHMFLEAKELGINLIDGDHFCTENPVIYKLQAHLAKQFPTVEFVVSEVHGQTAQFI